MRFKSRSRALVGAAAAALLGLAGLTTVAPSAGAAPAETERLAGAERWGTAADIATEAYPTGADTVVLANGLKFPDALAAGGLAGANDAPILLTLADSLPAETEAALTTLDPTNIIVVGGTAVVSAELETALEADGFTVTRVAGDDRFETAADIAGELGAVDTVFLANGLKFPDALAISPGSAKAELPVLLTPADSLNADAAAAIDASGATNVVILGGTAAVSQDIQDALEADGLTVTREAGATRYETATEVADYLMAEHGFSANPTHLATGEKFPDALAGGPFAALNNGPIILTFTDSLAPAAETWLTANAAAVDFIWVFGGTAAVSDATVAAAAAAADEGTNQSFTVTPDTLTTLTHNGTSEATSTTDDRTYSVSGLDDTVTYRLALFPAENVTNTDGTISFADVGDDGLADGEGTAPEADIVKVNNATITAADEVTVNSVGGNLTFTIDGVATGTVTPVLYVDGDSDTNLDLDADNEPTEAFGVGGATRYTPAEATGGAFGAAEVSLVDKAEDFLVAGGATYFYDSNDAFQIGGVPSTFANWEAALSSSDQVSGTYATDADASSTFNLVNDNPGTPTAVTPTQSGTSVSVAWTPSGDDVDSFNIYRALSGNGTDCAAATTPAAAYSVVGTDTASPFTDTSVSVPEQYCYSVTEVNDGDEGDRATPAFVSLTAVDAAAPTISMTYVSTDNGLQGDADATDVHRFIFSEPMNTSIDAAGSTYRVQDADGTVADFVCGTNATCDLHESATTIGTTTYDGGEVMEVTIGAPTIVTAGTTVGVQYPATITAVSAGWDDAAGNQLDLAGSADKTIELNTSASAVVNPAPALSSVSGTTTVVTTTWSEAIATGSPVEANVHVYTDNTCTTEFVDGGFTIGDDDGDTVVTLTPANPLTAATTYYFQADASAVQDLDAQGNAETACTSFATP